MIRWLKYAGLIGLALLALLLGALLVLEWRPEQLSPTPVQPGAESLPQPAGSEISLLSWNLGYAGLDAQADFFMDGGQQVRPDSEKRVASNLRAMLSWLQQHPADVVLLQEIDSQASRTYSMDQVARAVRALPQYFHSRALNFKVPWIPVPVSEPLGRVHSGLLTLTRHPMQMAQRHQLPGSYAWPVRVFHLKRCVHEVHFPAPDGRQWVILHLHLSAFDQGGKLRRQEMDYLKKLMLRLYAQGHHVIVGGDWNQAFPAIGDRHYPYRADIPKWYQRVPRDWTPSQWTWAMDDRTPSLRATNTPYKPGTTFLTTVDGFLLSPDLELLGPARCTDLAFSHTDHHPVEIRVAIKGSQAGPTP